MLLRVWENKHYHKLLRSINCCTYFWNNLVMHQKSWRICIYLTQREDHVDMKGIHQEEIIIDMHKICLYKYSF